MKRFFLTEDEAGELKRLIWVSPTPEGSSSFGAVSNELLNRLQGYSILYLGQHYYGKPRREQNYFLAPYFSGDHIIHYVQNFKPYVTIFFQSPNYLHLLTQVLKVIKDKTRIVIYAPIEGYPNTLDVDPLFSTANQILVPSRYSQQCLQKQGYKSEVLYHAVDPLIFKPTKKPNDFTVGSIASDVWRKQLPRLIDAHKICVDRGFNIKLLMVTSTYDFAPWQPRLKQYAEKTSPTTWFNETAYLNLPVSQQAIATLYNQFHVLAQPSTEAFGLTVLEAMASGVVPIIVNHGGSPEVAGDCGIYARISDYLDLIIGKVALVDVQSLADKIMWAYQHPYELNKLAEKGLERSKEFNWIQATNKLEQLLS